jgi:glyoxylase-like metal-dependent hydrolase (beta-lactamase superfamily II)
MDHIGGVPDCGGIVAIHTSGHICLYHKSSRTLIAGENSGCVHPGILESGES